MVSNAAIALRAIAVVLAVVIGLSAAPQAFAAQGTGDQPEGVTDASAITFAGEDGSTTLILAVLSFEDDDAASNGLQELIDATITSFNADAADAGDSGTPAAGSEAIELTDLEGLDDLGDEARMFDVPFGEGVSFINLYLRDGTNVHYWAYVAADLGALDGSEATPEATPAGEAPVDVLLGIATPWFVDGIDRDAALIDQLPGTDDVPAGFTEIERQESLDLDL